VTSQNIHSLITGLAVLPNACASSVCKAMMTLADSVEGRRALLQNAGTMFHVKRQMLGEDDALCSDASLLYLALQEQADGRSSSIALPRAVCKLSLQLTGTGGRDVKRWVELAAEAWNIQFKLYLWFSESVKDFFDLGAGMQRWP
jgi:hypothetical protein